MEPRIKILPSDVITLEEIAYRYRPFTNWLGVQMDEFLPKLLTRCVFAVAMQDSICFRHRSSGTTKNQVIEF
jgi:peroxiredoxin